MRQVHVEQLSVGGFDDNLSYVLWDAQSLEALVVDPCGDFKQVTAFVKKKELLVRGIILTHIHFDHMDRLDDALDEYGVPVYVHESAGTKLLRGEVQSISEGSVLPVGTGEIVVLATPGHHESSVCLYVQSDNEEGAPPALITGDTLFVEGCGRTDRANVQHLYESLQRLKQLPDETWVYPGHDYGSASTSTLGKEKIKNKYLLATSLVEFKALRLR